MKKYVAYFDILGYGNRIKNKSLSEEYDIQKKFIDDRIKFIDAVKENMTCQAIHFSDTHILFTNDDSEDSFDKIVRSSLLFMIIASIRSPIYLPLRGAICCGEFLVDQKHQIVIGQGLRDAYALAAKQEWMGCSLSDSCYRNVKSFNVFNEFKGINLIVEYPVPMKEGSENKYVINMESFIRVFGVETKEMPICNPDFIENIFTNKTSKKENLLTLDEKAKIKLKNTQEYYAYIDKLVPVDKNK